MRVENVGLQAYGAASYGSVGASPAPRAFERLLAQAQAAAAPAPAYRVKRGDTLSHIIRQSLREAGQNPSTAELYAAVHKVATANNLVDANVIHPGQTIDLSVILPQMTLASAAAPAPEPPAAPAPEPSPEPASTPEPADPGRSLEEALPLSARATLPERVPAAALTRPASRTSFSAARSGRRGVSRSMGGPAAPHADPTAFQLTAAYSLLDPTLAGFPATPVSRPVRAVPAVPAASSTTPWSALLDTEGRITSDFGPRLDPFTGRPDYHDGIDIAADFGSRIRPAGSGVVTFSGWRPGYGKMVSVRHDDGTETVYGHNAANLVEAGDRVTHESVIALLGNTGRSTGPHVHFEVRVRGRAVDPVQYLSTGQATLQ
ncbi:MAG: peptidoglycan DD-metalloendopeptidase family protein [Candidatus Hydrogenedentes bacterium]|nr:peptidoglycan DD-metalloendopeptidase family protein [Candidatus Hydrogenedentota bacterium]